MTWQALIILYKKINTNNDNNNYIKISYSLKNIFGKAKKIKYFNQDYSNCVKQIYLQYSNSKIKETIYAQWVS